MATRTAKKKRKTRAGASRKKKTTRVSRPGARTARAARAVAAPAVTSAPIPESALVNRLGAFAPFTYDLDDARYPYALPGVTLPLAPPNTNNCCTFVEALVVAAWADTQPGFTWNKQRHRQMMIIGNEDMFSPVTAVVEAGMARAVANADTPPACWTLIQGWRQQWRDGHTLLVIAHHPATDRVLTLESNSAFKLNGVGFRAIGNLTAVGGRPPPRWWDLPDLWTWAKVCSVYRFRRQAALNVVPGDWCKVTA